MAVSTLENCSIILSVGVHHPNIRFWKSRMISAYNVTLIATFQGKGNVHTLRSRVSFRVELQNFACYRLYQSRLGHITFHNAKSKRLSLDDACLFIRKRIDRKCHKQRWASWKGLSAFGASGEFGILTVNPSQANFRNISRDIFLRR